MIMRRKFYTVVAVLGLAAGSASAAMVASDNAANYASGGWGISAPNLGSGFGPWDSFATNNAGPPYAGTYLDNSTTNVSTATYSWGTYANSPTTILPAIDLVRPFLPAAGGYSDPSTLGTLYSQTFSLAMQTFGVGGAGSAFGFSLDTGQGAGAVANPVLTLAYVGGQTDNMTLIDNDGTDNIAVPLNFLNINGGLLVSVTVGNNPDGLNPYTLTVSPAPGNLSFTTPYVFSNFTNGPIQQVDMFDRNTDSNGYFNLPAISPEVAVPEPASIGLMGGLAVLLLNRKRNRVA
jgi:hypothetical protein